MPPTSVDTVSTEMEVENDPRFGAGSSQYDSKGRPSHYRKNLGNGNLVETFVIYARGVSADEVGPGQSDGGSVDDGTGGSVDDGTGDGGKADGGKNDGGKKESNKRDGGKKDNNKRDGSKNDGGKRDNNKPAPGRPRQAQSLALDL